MRIDGDGDSLALVMTERVVSGQGRAVLKADTWSARVSINATFKSAMVALDIWFAGRVVLVVF